eukprot:1233142-Rhodomonas_salina.3
MPARDRDSHFRELRFLCSPPPIALDRPHAAYDADNDHVARPSNRSLFRKLVHLNKNSSNGSKYL